MKHPHSNRPGGSGQGANRGPSNGPPRGFGGGPQRPPGGPRNDRPRQERQDGPRQDGARQDGARQDGPQGGGQGGQGKQPFRPRQDERGGGRPFHAPRNDAPPGRPREPAAPHGTVWLYGQHAVAAALGNGARRLRRLLLTEEAEAGLAARRTPPWPLQPERVDRGRLEQLLGRDIAHQGVALLADPLPTPSLQSVLERPGPIIVLDQVTDPRNVGAILRSAAAFGAAAVIAQDRNAPDETGALAKAASGALETMPLLRAVNIARTLIALRAANCWIVGLDASGRTPLSGPAFADRRIALVLGAEGEGLRRLTRETCDELAALVMRGPMESLNVSAAAAIALYELGRRA